jgi:hypothetical protein
VTRRALLATLIGVPMTAKNVTAQAGFHVTGPITPIEQEKQEGYFPVGTELALMTHPKSPIYDDLLSLVGRKVRVHVVPDGPSA